MATDKHHKDGAGFYLRRWYTTPPDGSLDLGPLPESEKIPSADDSDAPEKDDDEQ